MKTTLAILSAVAGLGLTAAAHAHGNESAAHIEAQGIVIAQATVAPEAEIKQAAEMDMSGPKETKGIKAVRALGTVPLAGEFEKPEERVLRGRELDIEPGGVVAVHRHNGRPGIAYIVSGQLTEHRVGVEGPVVKKAGDIALEQTGTIHWWENEGDEVARIIVVDLIPPEQAK